MNKISTVVFIFLLLLLTPHPISAQGDAGCQTDKCHVTMGTMEFIHGPVGAGICTICHTPVEGKKHKFIFAAEQEELCFNCHDGKRDMMLEEHLHTPVADGNCVGCHDPHQSNYRYTLKGDASELCFTCHAEEHFDNEYVHGPIAAGDCNVCHNPHASANEKQLVAPKKDLCFSCHKEKSDIMNKRHIHSPVAEDCTKCHNPHANKEEFLLGAANEQLCYGCHENIAAYVGAKHQHAPVAEGKCMDCHDVHASDNPRMFVKPQEALCFSCHNEMGDFVSDQKYKHGPVKEGDCNACHDPHGSEYHRILRDNFPEEFYMPYDTDNYAICFQCHNKDIALNEKTKTLTDFRDGDINLHFLHVNKEKKGRSCKACHQVHASSQSKHIRESVPFGKISWELPVTYTKLENGGSCVVGCHSPKEYNRKK